MIVSTFCHITEDLNLHQHHWEKLTACIPLKCWWMSVSLNTCSLDDDTYSVLKAF